MISAAFRTTSGTAIPSTPLTTWGLQEAALKGCGGDRLKAATQQSLIPAEAVKKD
jgi:hypothetical protein